MGSSSLSLDLARNMVNTALTFTLFSVTFSIVNSFPHPQLPFPSRGSTPNARGEFSFSYSNNDQRSRQARQSGFDTNSVEGSYSFVSPEGELFSYSYTADENGYFPKGPAIHPALAIALRHLRKVNNIRP